jgi:hypothetical protein
MSKILLDTDICLDAATHRDGFVESAVEVLAWAAEYCGSTCISSHGLWPHFITSSARASAKMPIAGPTSSACCVLRK